MIVIITIFVSMSYTESDPDLESHVFPECRASGHRRFTNPGRGYSQNKENLQSDNSIASGWYRFESNHYDRMIEYSELPTSFFTRKVSTFRPCGSSVYNDMVLAFPRADSRYLTTDFYVLNDKHPNKAHGRISTTAISCRFNATIQHSFGSEPIFTNPECIVDFVNADNTVCTWLAECGKEEVDILVRNCDGFFVYYLQPVKNIAQTLLPQFGPPTEAHKDPVYCGIKSVPTIELPKRPECSIYVNKTDPSRHWYSQTRSVNNTKTECQDSTFPFQWTRFLNDNSSNSLVVESCQMLNDQFVASSLRCGGLYHGWMLGKNPTEHEGRVERTICYALTSSCVCSASSRIYAVNCAGFYIYKRVSLAPVCYARICTDKQEEIGIPSTTHPIFNTTMSPQTTNRTKIELKRNQTTNDTATTITTPSFIPTETPTPSTNLCTNYATVVDDTRMFDYMFPKSYCDHHYRSAVRFKSSVGEDLMLKEDCTSNDVAKLRYFCGSNGISWLTNSHPGESGLPVERTVCVNKMLTTTSKFPEPSCECDRRLKILVQNCSSFYVYKLDPLVFANNDECPSRYCTVKLQKNNDIDLTTTTKSPSTIAPEVLPSSRHTLKGSLHILNPMFNFEELKEFTLLQPTSNGYKFIFGICTDILNKVLSNNANITGKITKLRMGSLIADYEVTSQQPINETKLENSIEKILKASPRVDTSSESMSFSGTVNASAKTLTDVDECLTSSCDRNAICINQPGTFQCICKDGYQGDGLSCIKVMINKYANRWSTSAIIIVSVLFAASFVVIVLLATSTYVFYQRSNDTVYHTSKNFHESGYDNYLKTDGNDENLKMNMYVAVEPLPTTNQSFQNETSMNQNGKH